MIVIGGKRKLVFCYEIGFISSWSVCLLERGSDRRHAQMWVTINGLVDELGIYELEKWIKSCMRLNRMKCFI